MPTTTVLTAERMASLEHETGGDLERLRAAAEHVIALLDEGVDTRGEPLLALLVMLAEWLDRTGEPERSRKTLAHVPFEETMGVKPQALLCSYLLDRGFEERAREHSHAVRRSGLTEAATCAHLGLTWETHGDPILAARWYTLGMQQPQGAMEQQAFACLRHRARRSADLPHDVIDEEAEQSLTERASEETQPQSPAPTPTHRRGPCPCGSGKRYKNCHGRDDATHLRPAPYEPSASAYLGDADGYSYYLDVVTDVPRGRGRGRAS